jgi:hypothetical protein
MVSAILLVLVLLVGDVVMFYGVESDERVDNGMIIFGLLRSSCMIVMVSNEP